MRVSWKAVVGLAVLLSIGAEARAPEPPSTAAPVAAPANDARVAVIERFHRALAGGDRGAALEALSADVVIFESGGSELSRDEYATHHLGPDMEFARATRTEVADRRVHESEGLAYVLTRSRTSGRFRDREIDVETTETIVLRRTGDDWTIAHIHWSSRPWRARP